MATTLVTNRLVLRPWRDDDFAPFAAMSADPEVMAFIGNGVPRTEEQARGSFVQIRNGWAHDEPGLFAVERATDSTFVGFCGLASPELIPEILPATEIGWRLSRPMWGQGLASEAARAVIDWAFAPDREPGAIDRLVAIVQVDNARSIRLAERLGMSIERTVTVPGQRCAVHVYELRAEQWRAGSDT